MLAAIAGRDGIPVFLSNQVGGNDSLIFDGSSLALDAAGSSSLRRRRFKKTWFMLTIRFMAHTPESDPDDTQTRPRLRTGRWSWAPATMCASAASARSLVALSGGIDSALVAAIAAEALGPENVTRHRHAQPLLFARIDRRQP